MTQKLATSRKTTEDSMASGSASPTSVQSRAKHHYLPDLARASPNTSEVVAPSFSQ